MERSSFWIDNPPDFIHLFFYQFIRTLKMDYPSLVWKRPIKSTNANSDALCAQEGSLVASSCLQALAPRENHTQKIQIKDHHNWKEPNHLVIYSCAGVVEKLNSVVQTYNHRQKCWEGYQFLPFFYLFPPPLDQCWTKLKWFLCVIVVLCPNIE